MYICTYVHIINKNYASRWAKSKNYWTNFLFCHSVRHLADWNAICILHQSDCAWLCCLLSQFRKDSAEILKILIQVQRGCLHIGFMLFNKIDILTSWYSNWLRSFAESLLKYVMKICVHNRITTISCWGSYHNNKDYHNTICHDE